MASRGTSTIGSPPSATIDLAAARELLVVVDRLVVDPGAAQRIADAVGTAFSEGDGDCVTCCRLRPATATSARPALKFTTRFECPYDGTRAPAPTPQLFSFNNPRGACPTCNGFGATLEYDIALIVPHPERSLREGAIDPWTKPRYDGRRRALARVRRTRSHRHRRPVGEPRRPISINCCSTRASGATRASSRSSRDLEDQALQAVHPRLPAPVPNGARRVPRVTARASSPRRCTSASPDTTSRG